MATDHSRKIIDIAKNNYRVAVPGLGAGSLAVSGYFLAQNSWAWYWIITLLGFCLTVLGSYLIHRVEVTNGELKKRLLKLEGENLVAVNSTIFLITANFSQEWQVELENNIILHAHKSGYSCAVLAPTQPNNLGEQEALLRDVLFGHRRYGGGLLIVAKLNDRITEIIKESRIPIVVVDANPPENELANCRHVSFVSVDDAAGGKLAATAVMRDFKELSRVFVLAGPAKHRRHYVFRDEIKAKFPKCEVVINEWGDFNRSSAEKVALSKLQSEIDSGRGFDAIFCTTDSMTLGCWDALNRIKWGKRKSPSLYGYDAVLETRRALDQGIPPLRCAVMQDASEVASQSINEIRRMLNGQSGRTHSVPSRLYPSELHDD